MVGLCVIMLRSGATAYGNRACYLSFASISRRSLKEALKQATQADITICSDLY